MSEQDPPAVSEFKSKSGYKRIFSALFYSFEGFKSAWKHEHSFRQELVMVVFGVIVALFLPISGYQKLMLIVDRSSSRSGVSGAPFLVEKCEGLRQRRGIIDAHHSCGHLGCGAI